MQSLLRIAAAERAGYAVTLPNGINTNHVGGAVYYNLGARF